MDEEIEKRIAELQKYFPLVKATIEWLQNIKDKDTREFLLRKMQGLHWILSGVPVDSSENEKSDQYKKTAGQTQDAEIDIKIEEMLASLDINPSS